MAGVVIGMSLTLIGLLYGLGHEIPLKRNWRRRELQGHPGQKGRAGQQDKLKASPAGRFHPQRYPEPSEALPGQAFSWSLLHQITA